MLNYLIKEKGINIDFDEALIEAISNEDIELLKIILCQSNVNINFIPNNESFIGDQFTFTIFSHHKTLQ